MKLPREKKFWLYKIIDLINWKIYIGITSYKNPIKRFRKHISASKNKNSRSYNTAICCAMREYGIENFEFKSLKEYSSFGELCKAEMKFIAFFESNNPEFGYNRTKGGDGNIGRIVGEKQRKKSSELMKKLHAEGFFKESVEDRRIIKSDQLEEIRNKYATGKYSIESLGKEYNTTFAPMQKAVKGVKAKRLPRKQSKEFCEKLSQRKIKISDRQFKEIERLYFIEKLTSKEIAIILEFSETIMGRITRKMKIDKGIILPDGSTKGKKQSKKRKHPATDEQIAEIERLYFEEKLPNKIISEKLGLTKFIVESNVRKIKNKNGIDFLIRNDYKVK